MRRLRERRRRLLRNLPPLEDVVRGSILERSIRCGRAGCHCADGPGHPVTYLSVTLGVGRTKQISLSPELVAKARHGVAVYQAWKEILEEISAINRELLHQERQGLRSRSSRGRGGGKDGGSGRRASGRRRRGTS